MFFLILFVSFHFLSRFIIIVLFLLLSFHVTRRVSSLKNINYLQRFRLISLRFDNLGFNHINNTQEQGRGFVTFSFTATEIILGEYFSMAFMRSVYVIT